MANQAVTVHLPEPLYRELEHRAEQSQRSVEDETLEVLTTAIPVAEALPDDLAQALAPLASLDDIALWQAARSQLASEAAAELEDLHRKRQREGLTADEAQAAAALLRRYEHFMLVRAQAAALLKQRGHDVSSLLPAS